MNGFVDSIESVNIPEGSAGIWWMAQAGFVFKTDAGKIIYLDTYLSDICEELGGVAFRRLSLAPIAIDDVRVDWFINSHEHADHLDPGALPRIFKNNHQCMFSGSEDCEAEYDKLGIPADRQLIMKPAEKYDMCGLTVYTSRADHGKHSPSALSLLFDFGKVWVWFTGDTALTVDYLKPIIDMKPDVVLPCINGSFGNMNGNEAAQLVAMAGSRLAIPCHFWMFCDHHTVEHGNPWAFAQACEKLCPSVQVKLLTPGRGVVATQEDILEI